MAQSFSQVLVHAVFSTKNRTPWIDKEIESELFAYIAATIRSLKHVPYLVGGHRDHVHILFGQSRTETLSKFIENTKVASSKWMKTTGDGRKDFDWQRGYGAFGVSYTSRHNVMNYIAGQEEHHKIFSYQDELRRLLKENDIEFDERYIWD
jgi:putative transposase